jgi:two-component system, NarL family, sensor histidine kinase UhpB
MAETLKILILEDSPADAEIIQRLLRKEKMASEFSLAINKETYLHALDQFQPDVILSDHSLPQFDSADALLIARQHFPEIPFIMVTGAVSEEFAADIIRLGADDYILKDRLNRLPAAIDNALKQRIAQKEKQEAKQKIIQSETNLRTIFENTSEGFLLTDREGIIKAFNTKVAGYAFFNREKEIQLGEYIHDFIEPTGKSFFMEMFSKALNGESVQYDRSYEIETGSMAWLDFSITPVIENKQVKGICITGRDITERKKTEEALKAMEQEILDQKVQEHKKLIRAIIRAQERERNHIGQELHDNINQILASTKLYLSMAVNKNMKLKELIKYPMELIDTSINEIRALSSTHVTPEKNINLKELVQSLLDGLHASSTIKTLLTYTAVNKAIDDDLKLNIYRIIQEQVNNIIKHAFAEHVHVSVGAGSNAIYIIIADDGNGFNVKDKRKGIGISNMTNRVESFNGEISIESSPGKGCKVQIKIPC